MQMPDLKKKKRVAMIFLTFYFHKPFNQSIDLPIYTCLCMGRDRDI